MFDISSQRNQYFKKNFKLIGITYPTTVISFVFGVCIINEVENILCSMNGTPFIFRVGQGSEMERAVKLDRELTEYGRGVLLTDTLSVCLRKAAQWAQTGLVLSVGSVGLLEGGADGEKKVEASGDPDAVCKARNSRLSRFVYYSGYGETMNGVQLACPSFNVILIKVHKSNAFKCCKKTCTIYTLTNFGICVFCFYES